MSETTAYVASKSTKKTYRYLRIGIASLPVLLGVSLVVEMFGTNKGHFDSISAYYYSPVQNAFVGTLLAMALGLVAVQGRMRVFEDLMLNVAGVAAAVVALVPTPKTEGTRLGAPDALGKDVLPYVRNGMTGLLATTLVGLVIAAIVIARAKDPTAKERRRNVIGLAIATTLWALLTAWFGSWWWGWESNFFPGTAHLAAAALMFGLIALVSLVNAFSVRHVGRSATAAKRYQRLYSCIAAFMTLGILFVVLCIGLKYAWDEDPFPNWLLYGEIALLVFFTLFWVLQTVDYWEDGVPDEKEEAKLTQMLVARSVTPAAAGTDRSEGP